MTLSYNSADASNYYYEGAAVDVARMDTSIVYGNLADAMKNSIVVFPDASLVASVTVLTPIDEGAQVADDTRWMQDSFD
jgi:hypothetical protein